ncbi:unnamed protein product [Victoria cruziana]
MMGRSPTLNVVLAVLVFAAGFRRCEPVSSFGVGGRWALLRESVGISAMHMQVLPNNMVVMFDRTDTGPSNLSLPPGRCRYDPSDLALKFDCTAHSVLYDIATNAVRPLTVHTDTWCSSGSLDADGRLVQTGGFNDGERVVRVLFPCPRYDYCDWSEVRQALAVRRWYATNQILPDGRIIIVGGRRQFNYEFVPSSDPPHKFDLRFLWQTHQDPDENNLYPFLHLLPDGNLFIFANTRSILFDYRNDQVLREFPPIPGSEPRNYPSSGSSVLLPIRLSNLSSSGIQDLEVLVCGGAPEGSFRLAQNGRFLAASSTCGRLRLTDEFPEWEMESMPVPRVMGDMLILPTGEILIINGARNGTAGWLLGRNPAKQPVIYRPYSPRGSRFAVMNPSPVPRMYHSSSVVLPDGRVLIGGSNPNVLYRFSGVDFPTELRLEAFSPPYLNPDWQIARPRALFAVPSETLGYKQSFAVNCYLAGRMTPEQVSVNLLSPSFTTHAVAMNQRMLVLQVVRVSGLLPRSTFRVTAISPPTAEIAPPGCYMLFVVHRGIPSSAIWIRIV